MNLPLIRQAQGNVYHHERCYTAASGVVFVYFTSSYQLGTL